VAGPLSLVRLPWGRDRSPGLRVVVVGVWLVFWALCGRRGGVVISLGPVYFRGVVAGPLGPVYPL